MPKPANDKASSFLAKLLSVSRKEFNASSMENAYLLVLCGLLHTF